MTRTPVTDFKGAMVTHNVKGCLGGVVMAEGVGKDELSTRLVLDLQAEGSKKSELTRTGAEGGVNGMVRGE